MPTYEYKCLDCGSLMEEFQKITDDPLTVCPKCNGHLKRLISAGTGPIFKGKGFYHTDYKNNSSKSGSTSNNKNTKKEDSKPVDKK